ncbi:cytochrome-c peroxidase [Methylovirgula ligni]|nr:cytochrome-c peroxidase [Methylovirgula ligni]
MSAAKVALGRRLFYDADLSLDGTTACATCHEQGRGFTDGNATHPGIGDVQGLRNVMGLANVAYFDPLTWADSTRHRLEQQAVMPLTNTHPVEMGMHGKMTVLVGRLQSDTCYRQMFAAAFPKDAITVANTVKAIASFERTMLSFDSPFDRYQRGDANAITPFAKAGMVSFFGKAGCAACHSGVNFTDLDYHNIGTGNPHDEGLETVTGRTMDKNRFRTPSLRNVAITAPYLHNGSAKTLEAAIRAHVGGDSNMAQIIPRGDVAELIAFLETITDRTFVTNPSLSLPQTACGKPF